MEELYFRLMAIFYPILKFLENIHIKQTSKEKLFSKYYEIESILKDGDVILSKSDLHATNLLNLGYWKHAIIYVGKVNNIPTIVESTSKGVIQRSLVECLSSKDRIVILRPSKDLILDEIEMKNYIDYVKLQVGKPYDYSFDAFTQSNQDSFYCSELVYSGIVHANPIANFELRESFGILTVTPMDLYNMSQSKSKKFEVILQVSNK